MKKLLHLKAILLTLCLSVVGGGMTSATAQTVVFQETFSKCDYKSGGGDGVWNAANSANIFEQLDSYTDVAGWTGEYVYEAMGSVKMGSSNQGSITTPAITALIKAGCFASITVMIQREVARRICAAPGTADYGAFSVFCQYYTRPELLFDVPPECFLPAPKVTSSVLRMVPCPPPPEVDDEAHFFRVVRAAFAQRRKTLVNSLSAVLGTQLSKEELVSRVLSCGLPENIRGERLSISDFAALSKALRQN